jgi:hypothetical protein
MDVRYQAKQFARGFKKADLIQQRMIRDGIGYGQSVLDPRFKAEVAKRGISSKTTPAQFLGAYTSRTLIDVRGLLDLGILKGTTENLEGRPELRLLGFPATLPMTGGFAGGTASALAASASMSAVKTGPAKSGKIALAGAAGSLAGIALGNMLNAAIATGNRPQLSSVSGYTENLG